MSQPSARFNDEPTQPRFDQQENSGGQEEEDNHIDIEEVNEENLQQDQNEEFQLEPESESEEEVELTEEEEKLKQVNFAAMLERAMNPRDNVELRIVPHGVFNIPERLMKQDETIKIFDYRVKLWGQEVRFGKVYEREMTEEEIANLKNKKKKKKNEGEEEQQELPPVDEEYEKLSDQEKKWLEYEDKYKHPALRWTLENQDKRLLEEAEMEREKIIEERKELIKQRKKERGRNAEEGTAEEEQEDPSLQIKPSFDYTLIGKNVDLLEKSLDKGGVWLEFERYPDLNEAEVDKLKKKFKGESGREINVLKCRAWVDLKDAMVPGSKHFLARAKVEQVIVDPNSEEECAFYDFGDAYVKIEVFAKNPITPEIGSVMPNVGNVMPLIRENRPLITNKEHDVAQFDATLKKTINALIDEYNTAHKTDLTRAESLKKHGVFNDLQKNVFIKKRKENFINGFVTSDKYDVSDTFVYFVLDYVL